MGQIENGMEQTYPNVPALSEAYCRSQCAKNRYDLPEYLTPPDSIISAKLIPLKLYHVCQVAWKEAKRKESGGSWGASFCTICCCVCLFFFGLRALNIASPASCIFVRLWRQQRMKNECEQAAMDRGQAIDCFDRHALQGQNCVAYCQRVAASLLASSQLSFLLPFLALELK